MSTQQLLEERGKTHGNFEDNARISQELKEILRSEPFNTYPPVVAEALDMICLKLSRIASGQWSEVDHFDDIAGYATLAANFLRK